MKWLFACIGVLLVNLALPVSGVWFLYSIFVGAAGFWVTLGWALLGAVITVVVGLSFIGIAGAIDIYNK